MASIALVGAGVLVVQTAVVGFFVIFVTLKFKLSEEAAEAVSVARGRIKALK
jgi:hypothetical protein